MNNLHNDYRGKPHGPSPCALPGAQGRLGQSVYQHGLQLIALEPHVCSQGEPRARGADPEFRSGENALQWEGRARYPGGQSWWEQEARPRQPRAESTGATTPRPSLLLFPISRGMVTSHNSLQHSTGSAAILPELHNPHHPPASLWQIQDGPTRQHCPSTDPPGAQQHLQPFQSSAQSPSVAQERSWVTGAHCSTSPPLQTEKQNTKPPDSTGFTASSSVPARAHAHLSPLLPQPACP